MCVLYVHMHFMPPSMIPISCQRQLSARAGATPRCTAEHSTDPAAGSDAATCGADEVRAGDSEVSYWWAFLAEKNWGNDDLAMYFIIPTISLADLA